MKRYHVLYVTDTLYADLLAEMTPGNGIVLDGVTLKDGGGTFTSDVIIDNLLSTGTTDGSDSKILYLAGGGAAAAGRGAYALFGGAEAGVPLGDALHLFAGATGVINLYVGGSGAPAIAIASTGIVVVGDGGTTNYSQFAADGELTLIGTARAWKSMDLAPSTLKLPGANPPAEDNIDGFEMHRYDRGTEESVDYLWTIPHDFATGTASVRGHFSFEVGSPPVGPAADEVVVMGFEYKKISGGDVFSFTSGTSSGTVSETIAADETAWIVHITSEGTLTTTNWAVHDKIMFRFYRDATNVADTYDNEGTPADNDVWVGGYHLEYLRDKLGEAS